MSAAYMRFWVGDWKRKTGHLHPTIKGAYFELIIHIFDNGSLPDDDAALARIVGCKTSEWRKIRPLVEPFFIMPGWRQPRAEEEREHARDRSRKAVESANARWHEGNYEKIEEKIAENLEKKREDADRDRRLEKLEVVMKTADASCERISERNANAYANAMLSESESESDSKKEVVVVARGRPKSRDEYQRMENDLRSATGLEQSPANGLMNLSFILGLLDRGFDFDEDILAPLRSARHDGDVSSWKFFEKLLLKAKADREAGATRAIPRSAPNRQAPLEKNWRPSAELVDYGKSLGLNQADVDWQAEQLRNWASGKERDDWPGIFKSWLARKAQGDGKQPPSASRMIDPSDAAAKRKAFTERILASLPEGMKGEESAT